MSLKLRVKRGEKSWNYFVTSFGILSGLAFAIVALLDIGWRYKVILVIISVILIFYLCFINDWSKNKIVGMMTKLQEKEERHDTSQ